MQLTETQNELIRDSFRKVGALGDAAGMLFYQRLFETAPGVRPMFPEDITEQAGKLTTALGMVVANIRNWDALGRTVEDLARRHVAYGTQPEHYQVVGDVLLGVLGEALGDDFTPDVRDAWATAYGAIASRMIAAAHGQAAA